MRSLHVFAIALLALLPCVRPLESIGADLISALSSTANSGTDEFSYFSSYSLSEGTATETPANGTEYQLFGSSSTEPYPNELELASPFEQQDFTITDDEFPQLQPATPTLYGQTKSFLHTSPCCGIPLSPKCDSVPPSTISSSCTANVMTEKQTKSSLSINVSSKFVASESNREATAAVIESDTDEIIEETQSDGVTDCVIDIKTGYSFVTNEDLDQKFIKRLHHAVQDSPDILVSLFEEYLLHVLHINSASITTRFEHLVYVHLDSLSDIDQLVAGLEKVEECQRQILQDFQGFLMICLTSNLEKVDQYLQPNGSPYVSLVEDRINELSRLLEKRPVLLSNRQRLSVLKQKHTRKTGTSFQPKHQRNAKPAVIAKSNLGSSLNFPKVAASAWNQEPLDMSSFRSSELKVVQSSPRRVPKSPTLSPAKVADLIFTYNLSASCFTFLRLFLDLEFLKSLLRLSSTVNWIEAGKSFSFVCRNMSLIILSMLIIMEHWPYYTAFLIASLLRGAAWLHSVKFPNGCLQNTKSLFLSFDYSFRISVHTGGSNLIKTRDLHFEQLLNVIRTIDISDKSGVLFHESEHCLTIAVYQCLYARTIVVFKELSQQVNQSITTTYLEKYVALLRKDFKQIAKMVSKHNMAPDAFKIICEYLQTRALCFSPWMKISLGFTFSHFAFMMQQLSLYLQRINRTLRQDVPTRRLLACVEKNVASKLTNLLTTQIPVRIFGCCVTQVD